MIKLYLLNKKGYLCLKNINPKFIHLISEIVIGQDANVKNDYSKEIYSLAQHLNIKSIDRPRDRENKNLKLLIAIGWRWMIHSKVELIIFHDSILPKYRGFNPLVTALINGDNEIGATVIKATDEFDKGDILKQNKTAINHPIKVNDAIDLIASLYAELLNDVLDDFTTGNLKGYPQDEILATTSLWRDEDDYVINWDLTASEIKRFIYAVSYPYKGAKTKVINKYVRIFDAEEVNDVVISNRAAGKVLYKINKEYTIVCGKGLLKVSEFFDDAGNKVSFGNKYRLRFEK